MARTTPPQPHARGAASTHVPQAHSIDYTVLASMNHDLGVRRGQPAAVYAQAVAQRDELLFRTLGERAYIAMARQNYGLARDRAAATRNGISPTLVRGSTAQFRERQVAKLAFNARMLARYKLLQQHLGRGMSR